MSDVDRLFGDYVAEHRSGGTADPSVFLQRVSPGERSELAALIDRYLSRAPRRRFDPAAFRGSAAEQLVGDLERALGGQSGMWPTLLPELRHRAGVRRGELVARLSAALGVSGREQKVAEYYHQMEQGLLPPAGVSDRVLSALGEIVGSSLEALRTAGEELTPFAGQARPLRTFARRAEAGAPPELAPSAAAAAAAEAEADEVDRLFRGG